MCHVLVFKGPISTSLIHNVWLGLDWSWHNIYVFIKLSWFWCMQYPPLKLWTILVRSGQKLSVRPSKIRVGWVMSGWRVKRFEEMVTAGYTWVGSVQIFQPNGGRNRPPSIIIYLLYYVYCAFTPTTQQTQPICMKPYPSIKSSKQSITCGNPNLHHSRSSFSL
jgi:hypothetical protein